MLNKAFGTTYSLEDVDQWLEDEPVSFYHAQITAQQAMA